MIRSSTAVFIFLITFFASSGVAHSLDTVEEIKVCAKVTDQELRLACFDNLGERVLREEPAGTKPTQEKPSRPVAETKTTRSVQPLPDELGKAKDIEYVGLITSCKKGRHGNWYFIFDNGQVWKEVNNRNHRFRECNFKATITRDMFGYKMRIDGFKKSIRVRRNQ